MAVIRWKGPDVLVIGWIPFYLTPPVVPGYAQDFRRPCFSRAEIPNPPIAFSGYSGFANWLYPLFAVGSKRIPSSFISGGCRSTFSGRWHRALADRTANGTFPGFTRTGYLRALSIQPQ